MAGSFKDQMEFVLADPILYGDYRNALDENEPRIYEDLSDHATIKVIFEEVGGLLMCVCLCVCVCAYACVYIVCVC